MLYGVTLDVWKKEFKRSKDNAGICKDMNWTICNGTLWQSKHRLVKHSTCQSPTGGIIAINAIIVSVGGQGMSDHTLTHGIHVGIGFPHQGSQNFQQICWNNFSFFKSSNLRPLKGRAKKTVNTRVFRDPKKHKWMSI